MKTCIYFLVLLSWAYYFLLVRRMSLWWKNFKGLNLKVQKEVPWLTHTSSISLIVLMMVVVPVGLLI